MHGILHPDETGQDKKKVIIVSPQGAFIGFKDVGWEIAFCGFSSSAYPSASYLSVASNLTEGKSVTRAVRSNGPNKTNHLHCNP